MWIPQKRRDLFLKSYNKYLHVIKEMKIDIIEGSKDNKWMI